MSGARYPWWMPLATEAVAALLLALGATWRFTRVRVGERESRIERGERCIFAHWHSRILPLVYTHRRRSIAVLVGRHRDGELTARVIERLGFRTARGSSTRGGEAGLRELLQNAEEGRLLAITPDGPRGPVHRVKPGLVYVASRTGHAVQPLAAAARRCWTLRSWDGFRIPQPFARLVVAYGAPITVPPDLSEDDVEVWRLRIEGAIQNVTDEADRIAAGGRAT